MSPALSDGVQHLDVGSAAPRASLGLRELLAVSVVLFGMEDGYGLVAVLLLML